MGTGKVGVGTLVRREDGQRLESVQTKRLAARGGIRGKGSGKCRGGAESALSGL